MNAYQTLKAAAAKRSTRILSEAIVMMEETYASRGAMDEAERITLAALCGALEDRYPETSPILDRMIEDPALLEEPYGLLLLAAMQEAGCV